MSVHYKFKSALDFDTVTFDGLNISVGDLKKAIIQQKRLGKVTDFDLQITNAQTKEEYQDDNTLIPKNTSLIIARIPISHQTRKSWNPQNSDKGLQSRPPARVDGASLDLSKMKGSEEDKILEMMIQSTADYDPKSYHRLRGHSQVGEVPSTYRCNKCKKGGHWIKNCPFNLGKEHMDVKRNTGIPRSFLDKDDKELLVDFPEPASALAMKKEIPEELICSICKDLFVDAVMIPCCGSSFCDDCVRTALLESEDNECPDCMEKGSSPGSLIPNRFLRNSVNAFKNENECTSTQSKKVLEDRKSEIGSEVFKSKCCNTTDSFQMDEKSPSVVQQESDKSDEMPIKSKIIESNHAQDRPKADDLESDYEDNITIMMPPVQVSPCKAFREQHYSGRNTSHPKPPGIDSSPRHSVQVSPLHSRVQNKPTSVQSKHLDWEHEYKPERDYTEENDNEFYKSSLKPCNSQSNVMSHYGSNKVHLRPSRPVNLLDVYSGPPSRGSTYQQMPPHLSIIQDASIPGPPNTFLANVYNQSGHRSGIGYQHSVRPIFHNVTGYPAERCPPPKVHQLITTGSLASVYQGVAAKVGTGIIEDPLETFNRLMREKERRREERRRSIEYRRSRSHERQQRSRYHGSPYRRISKEIKGKTRLHDTDRKHENGLDRSKFIRHRRSVSFSDRSSRSRSWSHSPHKKRSKSPYTQRSRSRTFNIGDKYHEVGKNHNSREDQLRKGSPVVVKRFSISPEKSHTQHNIDWYSHETALPTSGGSQRYNLKKERLQESPSETLEPPPPGYEWNQPAYTSSFSVLHEEYKHTRRNTPDVKELRTCDIRRSLEKSPSKSSSRHFGKKRKYTRSTSPVFKKQPLSSDRREKSSYKKTGRETESKKSWDRKREEHNGKEIKEGCKDQKRRDVNTEKYATAGNVVSKNKKVGNFQQEKSEKEDSFENTLKSVKLDSKLVIVVSEKIKSSPKEEVKLTKKLKERKKKRKDKIDKKEKNDRKKLKKDKRSKRERDKQKIETENDKKSSNDFEISRTPDIKVETEQKDKKLTNYTEIPRTPDIHIYENLISTTQLPASEEGGPDNSNDSLLKGNSGSKTQTIFKNVDSVLDIHDYETDYDEINSKCLKQEEIVLVPELSKWEREEQNIPVTDEITSAREEICGFLVADGEKVTNEVLRKAENAIFARAVKTVHPLLADDGNSNSQKVCDKPSKTFQNAPNDIKNFEITVPTRNSQERSVQIRNDARKRCHSPKITKSVKERLGSKIFSRRENSPQRNSSKSSVNKREVDYHSKERNCYERYRNGRDRNMFKDHDWDGDYKSSRLLSREIEVSRREKYLKKKAEESPIYVNPVRHRSDDVTSKYEKDKNRLPDRSHRNKSETYTAEVEADKNKNLSSSENVPCFNQRSNLYDKNNFKIKNDDIMQQDSFKNQIKTTSHINDMDSCSMSVESSSDSDTDRQKKHKYKKDKKRSKRSLSAESGVSLKEKHVKSKKRSKSSKRKKKSKK